MKELEIYIDDGECWYTDRKSGQNPKQLYKSPMHLKNRPKMDIRGFLCMIAIHLHDKGMETSDIDEIYIVTRHGSRLNYKNFDLKDELELHGFDRDIVYGQF